MSTICNVSNYAPRMQASSHQPIRTLIHDIRRKECSQTAHPIPTPTNNGASIALVGSNLTSNKLSSAMPARDADEHAKTTNTPAIAPNATRGKSKAHDRSRPTDMDALCGVGDMLWDLSWYSLLLCLEVEQDGCRNQERRATPRSRWVLSAGTRCRPCTSIERAARRITRAAEIPRSSA